MPYPTKRFLQGIPLATHSFAITIRDVITQVAKGTMNGAIPNRLDHAAEETYAAEYRIFGILSIFPTFSFIPYGFYHTYFTYMW
jgi:hypothetical protein